MIISDAPNCGINYDHHYDDRNSFIIQAIARSDIPKFTLKDLKLERKSIEGCNSASRHHLKMFWRKFT
jgi:hypothetical protein